MGRPPHIPDDGRGQHALEEAQWRDYFEAKRKAEEAAAQAAPLPRRTGPTPVELAINAIMKIGGSLHIKHVLDLKKPETITAFNTFGEVLLDAYNRGYADAKGEVHERS